MSASEPQAEPLPPHRIERARSARSRCKTCRRAIEKDGLRLGVLIEGPFGQGFLWHHLKCGARRQWEAVEAAYEAKAWAPELEGEMPPLEELRKLVEAAEKKKQERKPLPYTELAPTGRSKCRQCDELIEKGEPRVALLRAVQFYGQVRTGPINVHPRCVPAALAAEENATEVDGFAEALRANSAETDRHVIDRVLGDIGELPA